MAKKKKSKKKKQKKLSIDKKLYKEKKSLTFGPGAIHRLKIGGIIMGVLVVLALVLLLFIQYTTVDTVVVEGNVHYTDEEIQNMVLTGRLGHNSVYLTIKYRDKEIKNVPFIETMDVSITSLKAVKITVYEKAMAGFVEYMGNYFYFDKDGVVVESSQVKTLGIPQIMGLNFDHIVLLEKLPVEDDSVFMQILDITQLLNKYEIKADKIYFDSKYQMTLYYGDARVKLGGTDYIDEKIMKLKMILPELTGKKGVLRLENYISDSQNVTFEVEK